MNNITTTQLFQDMLPYFSIQSYGRDGGILKPRERVEIKRMPPALAAQALRFTCHCPACGSVMHPFRMRSARANVRGGSPETIYFAAACAEIPEKTQVQDWLNVAADPSASLSALRSTLREAANSYRTCCKGKAATTSYKAFIAAVKAARGE